LVFAAQRFGRILKIDRVTAQHTLKVGDELIFAIHLQPKAIDLLRKLQQLLIQHHLFMLGIEPFSENCFCQEHARDKQSGKQNHGDQDNLRVRETHAGFLGEVFLVPDDQLIPRRQPVR
jgi:hypothetical protein